MELLNPSETAKELRVHPATIRRLIARGEIPHHRIGKKIFFTLSDIKKYVDQCAVQASTSNGGE